MKEPALLLHCRRADLEERYKLLGLLYICIEEDYGKFWGKERAYKFTHSTILHECMDRNIATTYVAESYNGLLALLSRPRRRSFTLLSSHSSETRALAGAC